MSEALSLPAPDDNSDPDTPLTERDPHTLTPEEIASLFVGKPWNRQPGETDKQWDAFTIYRDMGPGHRSIAKADEERRRRDGRSIPAGGVKQSSGTFTRWSIDNRWGLRVAAFDNHQDEVQLASFRKSRTRTAMRQADQAARTSEALMLPVHALERRLADLAESNQKTDLDGMKIADLIELVTKTAKLIGDMHGNERSAHDMVRTGQDDGRSARRTTRGMIVRQLINLGDPDAVEQMEKVAFQISEEEQSEQMAGN